MEKYQMEKYQVEAFETYRQRMLDQIDDDSRQKAEREQAFAFGQRMGRFHGRKRENHDFFSAIIFAAFMGWAAGLFTAAWLTTHYLTCVGR